MATLDRPKLRPLAARRFDHRGRAFMLLEDPLGVVDGPVLLDLDDFRAVVRYFDGRATLGEIRAAFEREYGRPIPPGLLERLVGELDRAMVLDGPTFRDYRDHYRAQSVRTAAHAHPDGPYESDPARLRHQLARFFDDPRGSGRPAPAAGRDGSLRGIIAPHIDFQRGGPTYTHAFKALVEQSDADVFVILGVAHQGTRHRFALTRKDFDTPLGRVTTDRAFVNRLAEAAGPHLFDDELAHRTEHSVEFQVVFLQYLLGGRRDFTIVPILVGSFHDLLLDGRDPIDDDEVRRFVDALRLAEQECGRRVAYIGGIDLGHVGPEFGDPDLVEDPTLDALRSADAAMLDRAADGDARGWFAEAAEDGNRWRVCGLAATYTFLHAIGPATGRLLRYDQAVNPERTCCVSFASLAFENT
jgi:AmmeMemoRadiSam system protein B